MACGPGRVAYRLDVTNPAAVTWAETRAAELVTAIAEDTRAAIRMVVTQGFENGVTARDIARTLRASIGLTERDAAAVMRRQLTLLSGGMDAARATSAAERYAAKLHRTRAVTIARTETMRAANEGLNQTWKQAMHDGLLPATAKKVWMTADPCPVCAPLDGEEAPVNGNFSVGVDPPLHPRCKCTMGIV